MGDIGAIFMLTRLPILLIFITTSSRFMASDFGPKSDAAAVKTSPCFPSSSLFNADYTRIAPEVHFPILHVITLSYTFLLITLSILHIFTHFYTISHIRTCSYMLSHLFHFIYFIFYFFLFLSILFHIL